MHRIKAVISSSFSEVYIEALVVKYDSGGMRSRFIWLKILEAIDYINSVSKKKPTKEGILKHMTRSNLKLQEEVLQMLLDNLEEEGILENRGDDSN